MASHFFTSRFGGVSASPYHENNLAFHVGDDPIAVTENRLRLKSVVGDVVFMNQSHGDVVVLVERSSNVQPNCDAMITQESGIYLGVLTADCIPLLLWDQNGKCVSAVHVGRRGLMNDIALKTIGIMRALGSEGIRGIIGPSICGKCYEVGEAIHSEVVARHPSASSRTHGGTLALDLPGALSDSLAGEDVHVVRAKSCTFEEKSLYSYRRDQVTGRFVGVISL